MITSNKLSDKRQAGKNKIRNVHGPNNQHPPKSDFPFYGILGEITRFIEPQTEADPLAIYTQLIVTYGNYIGRTAYFEIDADRHYPVLFIVLVGKSSLSRKGTSAGYARRVFELMSPIYSFNNYIEGLSTGEGLIWHVRDNNPASLDKRLLVVESEFARVIKVMRRPHDTLSVVLRNAWDCKSPLRTITKLHAARATNAHVSVIGHITLEELTKEFNDVDVFNGFANRFLWLSVERSQILPQGGIIDWLHFQRYIAQLKEVSKKAKCVERMIRDDEAREHWESIYGELTVSPDGMLGAATQRATAQVARISMILALTDGSPEIKLKHQVAAMALWNRCFKSAFQFFGEKIKNKRAQKIYDELKRRGAEGMKRSDMTKEVFNFNITAKELGEALEELKDLQLVYCIYEPTGGAPAQRWLVKISI